MNDAIFRIISEQVRVQLGFGQNVPMLVFTDKDKPGCGFISVFRYGNDPTDIYSWRIIAWVVKFTKLK